MKYPLYTILGLIFITSCSVVKTLEGRAKPVDFVADSSLLGDSLSEIQAVRYPYLMGLTDDQETELFVNELVTMHLRRPAFFKTDSFEFLIYPEDKIRIGNDQVTYLSSKRKRIEERNKEVLILKKFRELEKWPGISVLTDYTYETIVKLEKQQKKIIAVAQERANRIIDSLCDFYGTSKKFKELVISHIQRKYDISLLILYEVYNDTLHAHQVYDRKLRELLETVNNIKKVSEFNENTQHFVNRLYAALFPRSGIKSVDNEEEFQRYFDSVSTSFSGAARGYLLSRIMYNASRKGLNIPKTYRKQYRRDAMSKDYRKIIARVQKERKKIEEDSTARPNELIMADGKTKTKLEDVLQDHKGKYVVVDLWASWCRPCLDEMPHLNRLAKTFSPDKIVFLGISIDADLVGWRRGLRLIPEGSVVQFLLLNQSRTELYKQVQFTTIPRYLIYDQNGILINTDAPRPSEPELERLLVLYLSK